ncbi:hypothetical protein NCCP2716_15500 [Sporosarcina sp. NCCP-2716]|nr:hypothetical protein NCCP2716_15500 [Sporosarcina sp. NCCP-2716]
MPGSVRNGNRRSLKHVSSADQSPKQASPVTWPPLYRPRTHITRPFIAAKIIRTTETSFIRQV